MPKDSVAEIIDASTAEVFALLHDYDRRLEWDTLLQKAYLESEFEQAALGAISVCQGRSTLGGFALRTEYVSFQPGKVAAVKMLNRPPFFETFAASIRHFEISENRSRIIYEYNFTARPKSLTFILHPLIGRILNWETRKRLRALKKFFAAEN